MHKIEYRDFTYGLEYGGDDTRPSWSSSVRYIQSSSYKPKGPPSPGWRNGRLTGTDLFRESFLRVVYQSEYSHVKDLVVRNPSPDQDKTSYQYTYKWRDTDRSVVANQHDVSMVRFTPTVWITEGSHQNTENRAVSRCVEEANSATYNIFEDIAEASETVELFVTALKALRNPVKTLGSQVDAYRRFLRRNGVPQGNPFSSILTRKALGANLDVALGLFSEAWMTYRYGVMPILYSIRDAHKVMKEVTEKKFTYTYRATQSDTVIRHRKWDAPYPEVSSNLSEEEIHVVSVTCTIVDRLIISQQHISPSAIHYGLLKSVPKTLWDITRWSWVVDWVCNAGGVVASWTGTPSSVSERVTHVSTRSLLTQSGIVGSASLTRDISDSVYLGKLSATWSCTGDKRTTQTYSRKVLFGTPAVSLQFDPYYNMNRLLDSIAILNSIAKKFR